MKLTSNVVTCATTHPLPASGSVVHPSAHVPAQSAGSSKAPGTAPGTHELSAHATWHSLLGCGVTEDVCVAVTLAVSDGVGETDDDVDVVDESVTVMDADSDGD